MENTCIIYILPPFYRNIKTELKKTPKVYFYDTGIMNVLRYQENIAYSDGKTLETGIGLMLLKKYEKERLKYWRTTNKQEIDFIITGESIFGYEAKTRYSKQHTPFNYFMDKYPKST
jgi:predicted AAA+ superfamily ATPase